MRFVAACTMESKLDIVTMITAVCVAAYAALAIKYVARYDLGFSLQDIRGVSVIIAVVIAALVAVDFFAKRTG